MKAFVVVAVALAAFGGSTVSLWHVSGTAAGAAEMEAFIETPVSTSQSLGEGVIG